MKIIIIIAALGVAAFFAFKYRATIVTFFKNLIAKIKGE